MENSSRDSLSQKKCKVCEVGAAPMPETEAAERLSALKGWELKEGSKIKKEFVFKGFKESMGFVNSVADIAEEEGHHPSIFISYSKVRITLSTFAIGGLSENDFIMAAKIDGIKN